MTTTRPVAQHDLEFMLGLTAPMWERVRGQRIFLTGGTGFFGCWLLESFLHANRALSLGASVVVPTRSPERFREKAPHLANDSAVALLTGDIRNFSFPEGEFPYVIHGAADTSAQAGEQPAVLLESIVEGTRRVMDFAATRGTRRMLLVSSGAVYGAQPPGITHISETYPGVPESTAAYGEGKRAAESLALLRARDAGIECMIARCFAFVGPHLPLDSHFAIGNFLRDAMKGAPIRIHGDGTPMRSYLYAADLAVWLWTILLTAPAGEAYNVGSDEAVSIAELARTVVEALDVDSEMVIEQEAVPGAAVARYVPSIAKAREQLGLHVSVSLRDAIRRTADWHRERCR